MTSNIIKLTDSYKTSHAKQYPPDTTKVFSYLASSGGPFKDTIFFGLQAILKKHLVGQVVTAEKIAEAKRRFATHGVPFNEEGWNYILNKHGGRLPVEIRAVAEGTKVPVKNVLMTVVNTDPNCFWLTNYLESLLLHVWYPTTVATVSFQAKKLIHAALVETGDVSGLPFKLHDFGFRGVSSVESAEYGGAAHLLNFLGTDTLPALDFIEEYYGGENAGFSIPATEHSTMTSWEQNQEAEAYSNLLDVYSEGLVACVSDSYDIYNAVENIWGDKLRDKVLQRNGTLVIRPDSGNACQVLPELLQIAWERFGGTVNEKGYKVLDPHVRFIWGDGITLESLANILETIAYYGFSADNVAFGMGGGLLQKCDRDTMKFAFKCSAAQVDGMWRDLFKNPITDHGKQSLRGQLGLYLENGEYCTARSNLFFSDDANELKVVFKDGTLVKDQTWTEVCARAALAI